ncbi:HalX domain-containing protein [Halovenus salina]|uniref:HalX domain-containing protein n=1 Tax=Halovenus salina TaxID=1510225 RepID=A0ABD5VXR2_9EURY
MVEDESDVAETYRLWLADSYSVRVAEDGDEGLDKLGDAVDVVLLDRRMPGLSGGEVLEEIRSRGLECRVAMVTAVEPDFDILEMGFDAYLEKPVKGNKLRSTVQDLLERSTYDSMLQEYYALVEKRATLEANKTARELDNSEQYQDLRRRIEQRRDKLSETLGSVDDEDDFITTIRELGDE